MSIKTTGNVHGELVACLLPRNLVHNSLRSAERWHAKCLEILEEYPDEADKLCKHKSYDGKEVTVRENAEGWKLAVDMLRAAIDAPLLDPPILDLTPDESLKTKIERLVKEACSPVFDTHNEVVAWDIGFCQGATAALRAAAGLAVGAADPRITAACSVQAVRVDHQVPEDAVRHANKGQGTAGLHHPFPAAGDIRVPLWRK